MIRSFNELINKPIKALDGEIGKLHDMFFDDRNWNLRCFIVELGFGLPGKKVVITPSSVTLFDGTVPQINLTKDEIRSCPGSDSVKPVSQQEYERIQLLSNVSSNYEGMWSGSQSVSPAIALQEAGDHFNDNPHLRSSKIIQGYKLLSLNGAVGTIEDILIDDFIWQIRFWIVTLHDNHESGPFLLSPHWIEGIEWALSSVSIGIESKTLLNQPLFDPERHLNRSYTAIINEYFRMQCLT